MYTLYFEDVNWKLAGIFGEESIQKLQQLECLRFEDTPPPPHDYPQYWAMLDPKSKQGKI